MKKLLACLWSINAIVYFLAFLRDGYNLDKILIACMAVLLVIHNMEFEG